MERERILIISHSYSPFLNPRAFRWTAIAEKWAEQGLKVDVITSWLPGLKRFEILNGVEIHRVGGGITERLRYVLRPASRATTGAHSKSRGESREGILKSVSGRFLAIARFINDKIWKNLYWPDYACLWIGPASSKALELCEMEKYSTMISVSDPFSSHLVGRRVKQFYSGINWVVDIGDPFSFRDDCPANNHSLYKNLNFRQERGIFNLADSITVTTENTRQKYGELFANTAVKIKVIPPAVKIEIIEQLSKRELKRHDDIKLVYVGTLYQKVRNPEFLLRLFEILSSYPSMGSLRLHFFGGFDDCRDIFAKYGHVIGEKLFLHGLVNRDEVVREMADADVLINIGNDNPYQLPSKLAEYVCLGKPIVNLHTIANDSSKEFLSGYPAALNFHTHSAIPINEQASKLEQFIKGLPIEIEERQIVEWKSRFGIEQIASAYTGLLKNELVTQRVYA